jgi:hypothetical protein
MQASWQARGTRIYGSAELVEREGRFGPGVYMRITPTISWSWGIEEAIFRRVRLVMTGQVS